MLNTKLDKAYGGQLFWKIWNRIDIEQLAKVWKFSDSMYNYLQRPNQVLAGRLPPMTLKTCTLGHPKCLKMLTAYWGKTYKGQMVWDFWDLIVIKELPKVWKLSNAMHHLQVLAGKLPKYTLKYQCTAHPKCCSIYTEADFYDKTDRQHDMMIKAMQKCILDYVRSTCGCVL